jgi:hypothetical protein
LGLAFRKKVVSLGVKKIYLRQLTQNAQKFKVTALDGLRKALKPYIDTKNAIKKQEGVQNWKDLDKYKADHSHEWIATLGSSDFNVVEEQSDNIQIFDNED